MAAESLQFPKKEIVDAEGFAGGIWLLWDDEHYEVDILSKGPQVIHAMIKVNCQSNFSNSFWYLSAIYGRPQFETRTLLWENLVQFSQVIDGPWLAIGDFNDVTSQSEKFGGSPVPFYRMRAYIECMNSCNLIDLGFNGPKFTWVNMRNDGIIRERLDRAWCNPAWKVMFPEASIHHLPRLSSDHCPILLNLDPIHPFIGNKPFRLEKFWIEHHSFRDLVTTNWLSNNQPFLDCSEHFKVTVRSWSRFTFDDFRKKKKENLARIAGIQRFLQFKTSSFLLNLEKDLTKEYQYILKCEEDMWFLKSRSQWIQEGDRNSKFFHVSALKRRSYNRIMGLKNSSDCWINDTTGIEAIVLSHFQDLYTTSHVQSFHDSFAGIHEGPIINLSKWEALTSPPSDREIWTSIKSMKPWKAPRPDGLHAAFFQNYWDLLSPKVCSEVRNVFTSGIIPGGWSHSLIALIPKVQNPEKITQFRPIGLCKVIYKAVTKILVFRLKNIIGELISPFQANFVPGRNGIDNVLILRELVYSFSKRKGRIGDMIIKLDLEKAYDRLEWGFIKEALLFFNFPPSLISIIMSCISLSKFAVIINGGTTEYFQPSRGLRQGDPLSPYLFILCIEYLSLKIQGDINANGWKGSKLGKSGPVINHLFFADDLIFIGKATMTNASYLEDLLGFFCLRSGQRVNLSKSRILFSANTSIDTKRDICSKLNISESLHLGKYLGFPITAKKVAKSDCLYIVDKVRSKLAGWKANLLSLAGRATLVSAVLSAIPNYYMQGMFLPSSIHNELDRISRQFIWGSTNDKKRAHLVSWDRITQPKKLGGLGIRSSKEANQVTMAKVHWRLLTEKEKIWSAAFCAKYKIEDPKSSIDKPSPVLKNISKGREILKRGIRWIPRSGDKVSFWLDNWVSNRPLVSILNGPHSMDAINRKVQEVYMLDGDLDTDAISYPLPSDIVDRIKAIPLQTYGLDQDSFIWGFSSNGNFQSKSAYYLVRNLPLVNDMTWSVIWKVKTLPKIHHFLWLLGHGKLLTFELLSSWGVTDNNTCPRCCTAPETLNHLFRECPYSRMLWTLMTPQHINSLYHDMDFKDWLKNHCASNEIIHGAHWNTIFSFIVWSIWHLRNQLVHDRRELSIGSTKEFIQQKIEEFKRITFIPTVDTQNYSVLVGWKPPPAGFVKLNTDGSALKNPGIAGAGGVFRDDLGNWLCGFSRYVGITTSLSAELWAIRDGLRIAIHRGFSKLLVETDSKVATILLDTNCHKFHSLGTLISDCRAMLNQFHEIHILHEYREANGVADCLAKIGTRQQSDFVMYDQCPSYVSY
ncbi:hypothetical protein SLA2020_463010, partial [Shorea laevis]